MPLVAKKYPKNEGTPISAPWNNCQISAINSRTPKLTRFTFFSDICATSGNCRNYVPKEVRPQNMGDNLQKMSSRDQKQGAPMLPNLIKKYNSWKILQNFFWLWACQNLLSACMLNTHTCVAPKFRVQICTQNAFLVETCACEMKLVN